MLILSSQCKDGANDVNVHRRTPITFNLGKGSSGRVFEIMESLLVMYGMSNTGMSYTMQVSKRIP